MQVQYHPVNQCSQTDTANSAERNHLLLVSYNHLAQNDNKFVDEAVIIKVKVAQITLYLLPE